MSKVPQRIWLRASEEYPVYEIHTELPDTNYPTLYDCVEVDAETLARWQAAIEAWTQAQDEMEAARGTGS